MWLGNIFYRFKFNNDIIVNYQVHTIMLVKFNVFPIDGQVNLAIYFEAIEPQ